MYTGQYPIRDTVEALGQAVDMFEANIKTSGQIRTSLQHEYGFSEEEAKQIVDQARVIYHKFAGS